MTKEERQIAAEAYAKQFDDISDFRTVEDIQEYAKTDFLAGAEAEANSKWVKYNDGDFVKPGYYYVAINGTTQEARVNTELYAELTGDHGFWQYSDCSNDTRVYPTHYMHIEVPSPPLNQQ